MVAEPKNPTQPKLRDWREFQVSPGKRKDRSKSPVSDGRALPRISELVMSHVAGTPAARLVWLQEQKAAGKLDGDDPDEIAEAEALLVMLGRFTDIGGRALIARLH